MTDISRSLRAKVIRRAGDRCEYCGLSQIGQEATFHVDHVLPRAAGGISTLKNLALACVSCSLRKGANQLGLDPTTEILASLFNPRSQNWHEHFQWSRVTIMPLSATGRATVFMLAMNRPLILAIREEESVRGRHPLA